MFDDTGHWRPRDGKWHCSEISEDEAGRTGSGFADEG